MLFLLAKDGITDMDRIQLGELLKRKRKGAGLTLSQMADRINAAGTPVSINYLSALERGGILLPSLRRLRAISLSYGVNPRSVSNVFYPNEAQLERESTIDRIFSSIVQDPLFEPQIRDSMLKEHIGRGTKVFIIKLFEKAKNTVLLKDIDFSSEDKILGL